MNRTHLVIALFCVATLTAGIILISSQHFHIAAAQGPDVAGISAAAATVGSRINYQGVLKEDGSPVTDARNFTFRFYTAADCTTQVGSSIAQNDVAVNNGLFSVKLDVDQALFDGQGLWLGVDVGSTGSNTACEEITPAPYALSLRPGAVIVGNLSDTAVLSVTNTSPPGVAAAPQGVGMKTAIAGGGWGIGVKGESKADYGGYFVTTASGKAGLYAEGPDIAAQFKGGVTVDGDMVLEGHEVYAQSFHTRSGGITTSSVTSNGDATYKSVEIPQTGGGVLQLNSTQLVVRDGDSNEQASIGSGGDATFPSVGVPQIGGGVLRLNNSGLRVHDSGGNDQASIGSGGDGTFHSIQVTMSDGGVIRTDATGTFFFDSRQQPRIGLSADSGHLYAQSLQITGQKQAVVSTASYGQRGLYTDESAELYFFDRGGGQLADGVSTIALDPIWLETVTIDADHPMRVQVTLTGDCNGAYVSEKTATGFTVRELQGGTSDATFDWEVAAKRKGYEDERLAPAGTR